MPGLFIAGTDTGVGKTIVTAGIAGFLQKQDIDCGVMKPVESGTVFGAQESDAYFLKKVSGVSDDLNLINLYTFKDPLAPGLAAEQEGVSIEFERISQAYQRLSQTHRHILVEGAGGLFVPLTSKQTIVDLIAYLQLPVLLVGRLGLGTLNHTLLSLEYLKQRKIPIAGVVFNNTSADSDLSTQTNPQVLQQWTEVPFWGVVGNIGDPKSKEEVIAAVGKVIGKRVMDYLVDK